MKLPNLSKRTKIALGVAAGLIALCGIGATLSGGNDPVTAPQADDVPTVVETTTTTDAAQPAEQPAEPVATTPALTVAQQNAVRAAQQYLDYSAFSRSGLIDQLEFEGYSTEDATLAVDSIDVDWMEQAAKSAEQYLRYSAFSRSGLIDQLEFEGFTHEQAEHGADAVGL